jgi:release factor glutamine methyltransferase
VHLYDIDPNALGVAYHNARQYDLQLHYYESNLLTDLQRGKYDILLANLPYVPKNLITSPEIEKEPALAIFSGIDGLSHYRRFWKQVRTLEFKPTYILIESLENQQGAIETLAKNAGYKLKQTDILVQLFTINKGGKP